MNSDAEGETTGSWRWSLAVWAVTAFVAALPWLGLARHDRAGAVRRRGGVGVAAVARTRIGWVIALFFGVQSVHAYAVYGWLPTIYVDAGLTAAQGGLMLGIMTAVGIPLSFWIPRHVATTLHPGRLMAVLVAAGVVGFAGLLVIPTTLPWLWAVLISIEISSFPAYLTLLGLRGGSPEATAALSGSAGRWLLDGGCRADGHGSAVDPDRRLDRPVAGDADLVSAAGRARSACRPSGFAAGGVGRAGSAGVRAGVKPHPSR